MTLKGLASAPQVLLTIVTACNPLLAAMLNRLAPTHLQTLAVWRLSQRHTPARKHYNLVVQNTTNNQGNTIPQVLGKTLSKQSPCAAVYSGTHSMMGGEWSGAVGMSGWAANMIRRSDFTFSSPQPNPPPGVVAAM